MALDPTKINTVVTRKTAATENKLVSSAADIEMEVRKLDEHTGNDPVEAAARAKDAILVIRRGKQALLEDGELLKNLFSNLDPRNQWLIEQIATGQYNFDVYNAGREALEAQQRGGQSNVIDLTPMNELITAVDQLVRAAVSNEAAVNATVTAVNDAEKAGMGSKRAKITEAAGTTANATTAAAAVKSAAEAVKTKLDNVSSSSTNGGSPIATRRAPVAGLGSGTGL